VDKVPEALERDGVELIFGHPGSLTRHPKLRHILARHE
jgi:thiamine pyrophosphate-dependent acetolactate synthase large subunit-like protein